ncbi:MAG: hypothetical protein WAU81_07520 [Candidatus Aminicenantales bacterium]
MENQDKKLSDQLVRLIQIFFGFVLGQSLGRYDEVVLHPLSANHFLAAIALMTVFVTAILSWIDWHITMELSPYNLSPRNDYRIFDQMRLLCDILIVVFYAYTLFSIKSFYSYPQKNISQYLWGFFFIFLGYFFSGILRRKSYGAPASKITLIVCFGIPYFFLALVYWIQIKFGLFDPEYLDRINYALILIVFTMMIAYRLTRRRYRNKIQKNKKAGLRIGIDVDGVLANQIVGILPRIKRRLGISLIYEDVTEWNLALSRSSIDQEISFAMEDREYVLSMPSHPHVSEVINDLYKNHFILITTARPSTAEEWTKFWLSRRGIQFDSINSVKEKKKSQIDADILVDDYINNGSSLFHVGRLNFSFPAMR